MPFGHEFGTMKLLSSFSAKTHPIHYFMSKTHILGSFAPFGCCKCTVPKSDPRMPFGHEFGPMKLFLSFPAKTHPIHYFRSKTHILGGFALFGCCKCTVAKSGPRMPFWHEFRPTKLFRDFLPKRIQSTMLGPKLMFWVVSHHLAAASAALPNRVLGCRFGTSLG